MATGSEPLTQTPAEYDAAYDAEMLALEDAEQGKPAAKPDPEPEPAAEGDEPPAAGTDTADDEPGDTLGDNPSPGPTLEELLAEKARREKALADTQRWAHSQSAEVKALKARLAEAEKKAEELEIERDRPADYDEDLEKLVDYTLRKRGYRPPVSDAAEDGEHSASPAAEETGQPGDYDPQRWAQIITTAHPDIEVLLTQHPAFEAAVIARKAALGQEWFDEPLVAIREINALKTGYLLKQREAELRRETKLGAMGVPGGQGDSLAKAQAAKAEIDVWAMSDADFEAHTQRIRNRQR
jgi:hypothetical protein